MRLDTAQQTNGKSRYHIHEIKAAMAIVTAKNGVSNVCFTFE